jgi:hypothetical protein
MSWIHCLESILKRILDVTSESPFFGVGISLIKPLFHIYSESSQVLPLFHIYSEPPMCWFGFCTKVAKTDKVFWDWMNLWSYKNVCNTQCIASKCQRRWNCTTFMIGFWHLINLFNPLRTCLDCVNSKSPSLGQDFSYSVFCFLSFTSISEPC